MWNVWENKRTVKKKRRGESESRKKNEKLRYDVHSQKNHPTTVHSLIKKNKQNYWESVNGCEKLPYVLR